MTWTLPFLVACILACAASAAEDAPTHFQFQGGNFNITSTKGFKNALKTHPKLLIAFTASSCLHCVNFEPEYIAATKELETYKIPLARMDLDKFKDIAEEYHITSLPVIKFFRNGKAHSYDGVHSALALKIYAEKQSLPAVREIGSKERLEGFKTAADITVLGFFGDESDEEDEINDFNEAAIALWPRHNIYFGKVTKSPLISIAKQWKWITKTPTVVLFQNYDINNEGEEQVEPERFSVLLSELSEMKLADWISKNSIQLVAEINHLNFHYYEDLRLPILMLFLNQSSVSEQRSNREVLKEYKVAATYFRNRISFVYCDITQFKDQRLSLGLLPHILPALAFNTLDHNLYPFPHDLALNSSNIIAYARDYLKGELKPKQKSAKKARPNVGDVVEVIGDTFNDIVMDENKDVMLLLYVNDAPDTETIMLYYKRVADRFKWRKADNILVARMDILENQLPIEATITKIPAILFFPANDKKPPYRMFHGSAKVRPLMLWAADHSSTDLKFENDTPDLDAEQRKAYEEQLAELLERRKKEKEEKERVQKLKDEWAAEEKAKKDQEKKEKEEQRQREKEELEKIERELRLQKQKELEEKQQKLEEEGIAADDSSKKRFVPSPSPVVEEKAKAPKKLIWSKDDEYENPVPIRKPRDEI